jgi:predicted O-methyltransferase YrrM
VTDERLEQLFREFLAQQRLPEYLAVARRIRERLGPLGVVIEIGSASGGTLALWGEVGASDVLLVSVDVQQGPEACYSDDALRRAVNGKRLALVRGDSRLAGTAEAVAQALNRAPADLLFIDGDHRAAVVRSDLRTYAAYVRNGGIVAFHDIVSHPGFRDVRVHELWWELRARFPDSTEEILEAPDQTWGGIGLLTMGPDVRSYLLGQDPIPVFINNFNRLKSTRALADWVAHLAGVRVVILDNNSDWGPLLEWYQRCPFDVRRLGANLGQRAPWISGVVEGVTVSHYVVTDPDLAMEGCPPDVLKVLALGLDQYPWATKAGVGLELADIPARYPSRDLVLGIERPYWQDRLDGRFFRAAVDTTFALYRSGEDPLSGPALRSDRPYVARHLPWYVIPGTLDEEERHYLRTADPRFSSGTSHTKGAYDV